MSAAAEYKKIRTAVFPVAGLGTRFLPATKDIPKEMMPLIDRPLIHHGVDEAVASGCSRVVFVTGQGKESICRYFEPSFELTALLRRCCASAARRSSPTPSTRYTGSRSSITPTRRSRSASATRCSAQRNSAATNISACCCPTT